jgi:hypothetical protein
MFRKLFCSVVVMVVAIGFVAAEEFGAVVKKADEKSVTFAKTVKGKAGEDMTLPVDANVKVNFGTTKKGKTEVGDKVEGGLKNEVFTKIGDKGLNVRITTDADNKKITDIVVTKKGK